MFSLNKCLFYRTLLTISVSAFLSLAAFAGNAAPADSAREKSFKGWELYSWKEGDSWQYAMLMGTNRLKTCKEIKAAKLPLTLAALETNFSNLAENEIVFWSNSQLQCGLSLPPAELRAGAADLAKKYHIELDIIKE